jgi:osmoprotectant transport system substrate-binding protein
MSTIASDAAMRQRRLRRRLTLGAACALALTIGALISGCSSASSSSGATASSTTSKLGAALLDSGTTPTIPTTPASTTAATNVSTTPPLPGTGKPSVVVGDKNFTEQFLLGELYYQALLAQGFDVSLTQNIGSPSVSMQAIAAHTLDVYPEYLDVLLNKVAHVPRTFRHMRPAYRAVRAWARRHGLTLLPPTPFSDTAGIAVTSAFALGNNLIGLNGMQRLGASMTIGTPPEFEDGSGGLLTLERAYGFLPGKVQTLNAGAQYAALSAGDVQAAYVNTTDGQLSNPISYTVLEDPHHVFGWGNVVPVVSSATLAAEGPVFARTIEKIDALLSMSVMRELNAEVDLDLDTPTSVARHFLEAHHLIPPNS